MLPISSNLHLHASQGPSFHPITSQWNPKSFVSYLRIRQTVIPSFRPNTPQSPWNHKYRDFSLDPAKTYYQTLNSFFQHLCFPYALLLRPFVGFYVLTRKAYLERIWGNSCYLQELKIFDRGIC